MQDMSLVSDAAMLSSTEAVQPFSSTQPYNLNADAEALVRKHFIGSMQSNAIRQTAKEY